MRRFASYHAPNSLHLTVRASFAPTIRPHMLAKLNTYAVVGIEAVPVEVEVDASSGMATTILVGLPEMAVKESIHRIESALVNLGYARPSGRIIINVASADLRGGSGRRRSGPSIEMHRECERTE